MRAVFATTSSSRHAILRVDSSRRQWQCPWLPRIAEVVANSGCVVQVVPGRLSFRALLRNAGEVFPSPTALVVVSIAQPHLSKKSSHLQSQIGPVRVLFCLIRKRLAYALHTAVLLHYRQAGKHGVHILQKRGELPVFSFKENEQDHSVHI